MLLLYSDINSPRLDYTFQLVFTELLGLEFELTDEVSNFKKHNGPKLSYANQRIIDECFIQRCELLKKGPVVKLEVTVTNMGEHVHLFPTGAGSDINYDIFAAIFYMVTRYEEYLPFEPDTNGRFKSSDSLAAKHNFLQKPVVNTWVHELACLLQKKYPGLLIINKSFSAIVTYDIDVAYQFRGRGFPGIVLSCLKDLVTLNYKRLVERINVARGLMNDPWDTYSYIMNSIKEHDLDAIFFFLVGRYSSKDKNLKYSSGDMKKLVTRISSFFNIGVHPSYFSSLSAEKISKEKMRMEAIAGKKITKSRQHFLKFSLPQTYRHLIAAGITEDYSMGFADAPGFRAGICTPYYFYDLKNESATSLKIFPVTCMEGNFIKYMKVSPEQSMVTIQTLLERIQAINGMFISIWHNHTLSDRGIYKGWKKVHEEMLRKIVCMYDKKPG